MAKTSYQFSASKDRLAAFTTVKLISELTSSSIAVELFSVEIDQMAKIITLTFYNILSTDEFDTLASIIVRLFVESEPYQSPFSGKWI